MWNWIIDIVIVLIAIWFITSRLIPAKGVRNITVQELKKELKDKNKQFIDVRTPGEYNGRHIHEFKNIPLHQLPQKLDKLAKDKEVVVICQSGMRSTKASKILKQKGFEKVTNVKGGMSAWS
jgi:rhodanese-related sulfurtransferase